MSSEIRQIPDEMLEILRERWGLARDVTILDGLIHEHTPADLVRECASWELGDREWADRIARWMVLAGAKPEDFCPELQ